MALAITLFLGIFLRFLLMSWGHNFDFESYCIVGDIVNSGQNVYASTSRYNYGPIFFLILGGFYRLASHFSHQIVIYRIFIVSLLTFVDFLIARIVSRKAGIVWGLLFFLNPISLIITGYHNQFDNIALLLGAYGTLLLEKTARDERMTLKDAASIALLSASLITKHILWAFPLWILLNREISNRKKMLYAFLPPLLFLFSFMPYWAVGKEGIIQNVFLYRSFENFPLFAGILHHYREILPFHNHSLLIFGLFMLGSAWIFRSEEIGRSFLLYTIAMLCFSSAIANQYLAIPGMALLLLFRQKSLRYFWLGGAYLACTADGLHIPLFLQEQTGISMIILIKTLGRGSIIYTLMSWFLLYYLIDYYKNERASLPKEH